MNHKKFLLITLIFLIAYLTPGNIFSDNINKANEYYEKYDYKLALNIYEKVMKKKPSLVIAEKIANCYRFINDTEGAEKAYFRVLSFPDYNALNLKYYADALKQNGKFDEAKVNYLLYGQKLPAATQEATRMANACDVAKMWQYNPDVNVGIQNYELLNSSNSDFSPIKYLNGIVFTSDRWFVQSKSNNKEVFGWTGNPYLKLYYLNDEKGKGNVEMLSTVLNQQYHNGPASFTPTGDTIFFTRTEAPNGANKKQPFISKKIYFAVKNDKEWSKPQPINLNSSTYSIQHPAISRDGSVLYFASDLPGGFGGMDIYASKKQPDGLWGPVKNCGPNINTAEDDVFPVIDTDGRFYFASKGHVGMGGLDIFTSEGSYNQFSVAENLKSPLNSTKDDFGILFKDNLNGYISSNRKGGKGLDDIYSFSLASASKPDSASLLTSSLNSNAANDLILAIDGQILDKVSGNILSNTEVLLLNKTTGKQLKTISDNQGKFSFSLEPEADYVISGNREKFYSRQEGLISTKGINESTIFTVKFELEKAEDSYIVRLNNIYYDFNKWNIRKDAARQLNKVVSFINTVSAANIQLRSHTDSRGKAIYNKWLSQKRAQSTVNYLVKKGVNANRLSAVGLGESELLNRCKDGIKCSIQGHRLNRRTEFKIIRLQSSTSFQ